MPNRMARAGSISAEERARRDAILRDIHTRIDEDGPHVARPFADRARQFMPFAALRGYGQMIEQAERRSKERFE